MAASVQQTRVKSTWLEATVSGSRMRSRCCDSRWLGGWGEVQKFIDTPVKRYSSGMYVRLAFAVAAFLDQACAGDAALRARVEELLRAHDSAASFLEAPPAAVASAPPSVAQLLEAA